MKLGRIAGTVVATAKDEKIRGRTLRIVELIDEAGRPLGDYEVAVDTVGAKAEDVVLTVRSSSARMTRITEERPVDNAVIAIVDSIALGGRTVYPAGGPAQQKAPRRAR